MSFPSTDNRQSGHLGGKLAWAVEARCGSYISINSIRGPITTTVRMNPSQKTILIRPCSNGGTSVSNPCDSRFMWYEIAI